MLSLNDDTIRPRSATCRPVICPKAAPARRREPGLGLGRAGTRAAPLCSVRCLGEASFLLFCWN